MGESFALELPAVEALLGYLNLPRGLQPYEMPHQGRTVEEHRRHLGRVLDVLREKGLAARSGRLDPDLDSALRALAAPDLLIVVRAAQTNWPKARYRAAVAGPHGVFSQQAEAELLIDLVRPELLVDRVVGELPQYPPVPLSELTVVTDQGKLVRDDVRADDFDDPLNSRWDEPVSAQGSRMQALAEFSAWPVERIGGYEVSARTPGGRMAHLGTARFTDTEGGRFVVFGTNLPDGRRRERFVPSDGSHLRRWLHETIEHAGPKFRNR